VQALLNHKLALYRLKMLPALISAFFWIYAQMANIGGDIRLANLRGKLSMCCE